VDDTHNVVEIGYASHTIGAATGRSATFCTHRPQHCAEVLALVGAATRPSLHIINRACGDGEEYLLLF
jgi:hypothetical protein